MLEHGVAETVLAFSALGIGFWLAISQAEKWKKLMKIITPRWIMGMGMVFAFCTWVALFQTKNAELRASVKRGVIALVIAILGEIGLTIAPFWTVFAVSYFMESWI